MYTQLPDTHNTPFRKPRITTVNSLTDNSLAHPIMLVLSVVRYYLDTALSVILYIVSALGKVVIVFLLITALI